MIDGKNFFDQPFKNNLIICDSIQNIATGQRDDYAAGCLLDYNCFKDYYKMTGIDLQNNKQLMLIQKQYNKLILQEI